jgi:hypothetical protein
MGIGKMGSSRRARVFDSLDLEIIDRVYEAAWARVEANYLIRDTSKDEARKQALRQWIFAIADRHPVDFDTLLDKLEKSIPEALASASRGKPRGSPPQVGA